MNTTTSSRSGTGACSFDLPTPLVRALLLVGATAALMVLAPGCGQPPAGDDQPGVDEVESEARSSGGDYYVDVKCRPAVHPYGGGIKVEGRIKFTNLHWLPSTGAIAGTLGDATGTLEVKTDPGGEKDKLTLVGGSYVVPSPAGVALYAGAESKKLQIGSIELQFGPAPSVVYAAGNPDQGTPTRYYYADCSDSKLKLPKGSDLEPVGTMRIKQEIRYGIPERAAPLQPPMVAYLDVINIGNQPLKSATGRVRVAGIEAHAVLRPGRSFPALQDPAVLASGERGYLEVSIPAGTLAPCQSYPVTIDLGQQMQGGSPGPFGNDTREVATQCLRWTDPYVAERFGNPESPSTAYKNLDRIVSSEIYGRDDNKLCSACHGPDSKRSYAPPAGYISATQDIGGPGKSWKSYWAARFLAYHPPSPLLPTGYKPQYLREMVQAWIDSGSR